ncbi:MAG TPA: hypothetical protein VN025_17065 [Candidatus Dormibacteraeota bacterium]|jgi:hypothetical protein|nr:hypothetical protein [Candidatus Dormibacteraeota bacterium]
MVILNRKAAEQNPASTAALSRVAISLSQRRALRHSAGAPQKATSSAVELKKKIREEVMNGTFAQKATILRMQTLSIRMAGGILAGVLAIVSPAAMTAPAERRVDVSRNLDRAKIENLQRWVSSGHEEWCKDARLVAMDELRRVAPSFAGNSADLEALPLDTESASEQRVVFVWSSPDGRATYRVAVERFGWLLPIAGDANAIVWVPTHAEVIAHR